MEIFLLETIDNVGRIGERVHVKPGYARNYLIPKGKAALATPENIARFEAMRSELEAKANLEIASVREQAEKLEGQVIRIEARVGAEGKLYGSVGSIDIAAACEELGVKVQRSRIRLLDGPLRVVGEHIVELHLHADVHIPLKVVVASNDPRDAEETAEAAAEDSGDAEVVAAAAADGDESAVSGPSDDAEAPADSQQGGDDSESA